MYNKINYISQVQVFTFYIKYYTYTIYTNLQCVYLWFRSFYFGLSASVYIHTLIIIIEYLTLIIEFKM